MRALKPPQARIRGQVMVLMAVDHIQKHAEIPAGGPTMETMTPTIVHAEPVLTVHNVEETIKYWQEVFGFPDKWMWGDPPTHGAVSWHGAQVQFSYDPALAATSRGNAIFVRVRQLEALYDFHKEKGADIVAPLENKPWGMAGYTVRDLNGYYIDFGGQTITIRQKSQSSLPSYIRILKRTPTPEEFRRLAISVGWADPERDNMEKIAAMLAPVTHSVVAVNGNTGEAVGCALLLGDKVTFYYVKDVMVHPDWQGKRIGTAMMKTLIDLVDDDIMVTLIAGEDLASFYQQFDFIPTFGMIRFKRISA